MTEEDLNEESREATAQKRLRPRKVNEGSFKVPVLTTKHTTTNKDK